MYLSGRSNLIAAQSCAFCGWLLMYMLVSAFASCICVKKIKLYAQKMGTGVVWSLSSVHLFSTGASLPYCPEWLQTVMISQGKEEREWRQKGEENQNKWLSSSFDPICREICVLNMLMFTSGHSIQTGTQTLFLSLCLPSLTLIGCHCQVIKGEVNGGAKSTRGHGYIDGKPHCLPERPLAVWGYGH